jgi:hypothetical protein
MKGLHSVLFRMLVLSTEFGVYSSLARVAQVTFAIKMY